MRITLELLGLMTISLAFSCGAVMYLRSMTLKAQPRDWKQYSAVAAVLLGCAVAFVFGVGALVAAS